ncbi:MAG: hypothetical protein KA419_19320 [Acidobacteria bacterium]|nr:hypothetical protein [Acidobacteriota bacterium]
MSFSSLNNLTGFTSRRDCAPDENHRGELLDRISPVGSVGSHRRPGQSTLPERSGERSKILSTNQVCRNIADGIGYLQTADDAMARITRVLQRAIDLLREALTTGDVSHLPVVNLEYARIRHEIGRFESNTLYNGIDVFGTVLRVNIGDAPHSRAISVDTTRWFLSPADMGLSAGIFDLADAPVELENLDGALAAINRHRAKAARFIACLGASQEVLLAQSAEKAAEVPAVGDPASARKTAAEAVRLMTGHPGLSTAAQANLKMAETLVLFQWPRSVLPENRP